MAAKASPVIQVGVEGLLGISFHRTRRVGDAPNEGIQQIHLPSHGENTAYTLMPVVKDDAETRDSYHLYTTAGEAMAICAKFLASEGHTNPTPSQLESAFKLEIEVAGVNVASPNLIASREFDNHFIVCNETALQTVWVDGHTVGIDKEDSVSRLVRQFVLIRAGTGYAVFEQLGAPDAPPDFKIRITPNFRKKMLAEFPKPVNSTQTSVERYWNQAKHEYMTQVEHAVGRREEIFVKTGRKTIICYLKLEEETIDQLMLQIQAQDGTPIAEPRLVFGGKQLEYGRLLSDYKIKPNNILHLVYRMRGGGSLNIDRCLDMAPGGLIKQKAEKPKGQYEWDSASAIEITVSIRPWSLKDPTLPELPPRPKTIGKAVSWNPGTDIPIQSISTIDAINPSRIPFLDPQEDEATEDPDPPEASQNNRRRRWRGFIS